VSVGRADANMIDASIRLIELMAQPGDAKLLAPLVVNEILIRLLRSPIGVRGPRLDLQTRVCMESRRQCPGCALISLSP